MWLDGDEDYQITTTMSIYVVKLMCVIASKGIIASPCCFRNLNPIATNSFSSSFLEPLCNQLQDSIPNP